MRFPWWGHTAIWLLFAACVYLPIGQLVGEVLTFKGGSQPSSLPPLLLTCDQWALLGRSVVLSIGATLLALVLGVPYAFLCERTDVLGRGIFSLAYLVPLLIPPYIHAIVWTRLLSPNGLVNGLFTELLGLTSAPLAVHNLGGAMFILAMAYFPFVTLLTLSGLKTLDRSCEEAAALQASGLRAVWRISFPMIRPHVIAGCLFVFVFSVIDFGVPDLLRLQVYPIEIFISFSALYDERAAVLLGLPLLALTSVVIALQVRTMRERSYVSFDAGRGSPFRYRLGSLGSMGFLFCAALIGMAALVPLLSLAVTAGSWSTYTRALRSSGSQIWDSMLLAAVAAAIMTLFSVFVAASMRASRGRWRTLMEYLSQIPFAVPPIVLGIGLIKLWNRPVTDWLYGTPWIIVLGYIAHFIPFAVRAVYANMQQLNPRLLEAASLSAAGRLRVLFQVVLPLLRNGLLTAFFIAFVLSFGELGVTLLVTPPGSVTMPVTIFNYMHYGAEATVSAFCLILIAIQLLFAVLLLGTGRWLASDWK